MSAFKILVTSQKGGVGKSTVSANLAAYLRRQGQSVTLVDFDTHGSSSTWLNRAPNIGIVVQHHILPLDQGGNRPILDARLHLRRAASSSDVVVCDLTWTDSIAGELMFEYDLVVVPTSVSEIELVATSGFLNRHRWVFDSAIHTPPTLLLCPTRVRKEQMQGDTFTKQRFPVSFMLAPPVLEAQSARESFERGYLMDLADECGASFIEFGKAVSTVREMRNSDQGMRQTTASTRISALNGIRTTSQSNALNMPAKNLLARTSTLSNQYSVLGRHRLHKVEEEITPAQTQAQSYTTNAVTPDKTASAQHTESISAMGIPQFLKRMSMGLLSK
jgi:cellulose biosynthesis protein BcsQ